MIHMYDKIFNKYCGTFACSRQSKATKPEFCKNVEILKIKTYLTFVVLKRRGQYLMLFIKATLLFCERLRDEFVFGSGPPSQVPVNRQNKFRHSVCSLPICKTPVNSWLCLNWSLFLIIWGYYLSNLLLKTFKKSKWPTQKQMNLKNMSGVFWYAPFAVKQSNPVQYINVPLAM